MSGDKSALPVVRARALVFGASVLVAGVAISILCLVPLFLHDSEARTLLPDALQEQFFFDLFGWIGGCWLLSWVSAMCSWQGMSRLGQWFGIILLCLDQVVLFGIWASFSQYHDFWSGGTWIVPGLLELFFVGYFMALFTMPALTLSGNRRLTGLGALTVLLPWLLGRQSVILGTQLLCGHFLH